MKYESMVCEFDITWLHNEDVIKQLICRRCSQIIEKLSRLKLLSVPFFEFISTGRICDSFMCLTNVFIRRHNNTRRQKSGPRREQTRKRNVYAPLKV